MGVIREKRGDKKEIEGKNVRWTRQKNGPWSSNFISDLLKAFFLVSVFQWKRMNGRSPCRSSKIQIATLHNTCVGGLERIRYWVCVSVCMNKLRTTLQRQKESSLLNLNTTGSNMKTYCVKTVAKIDHLIVFIHLIFVIILQKKSWLCYEPELILMQTQSP